MGLSQPMSAEAGTLAICVSVIENQLLPDKRHSREETVSA